MKSLLLSDDAELEAAVPICRKHGFGIEMQSFYDPSIYSREPEIFRRHLRETAGINPRSVHGCFCDLCPGSFDEMVSDVALKRYELSYHAALHVKAEHLVVHHGYVPHTSYPDRWLKRSTTFWKKFLSDKDGSVRVHMENTLDWEPGLLADLVDSIGSGNLDINLDIGHAHCDSRTPVLEWIRRLGRRIGYVHLHDNHGAELDRLPLGEGSIPLKEVFSALEQIVPDAYWVIETKVNGIEKSIEWLAAHGFLKIL